MPVRKYSIIIASLISSACLLAGCMRASGVSKVEYLGNLSPQESSANILHNLTRAIVYQGARVDVNPITGTLLQARVWEEAVKRGLPHDDATNKKKANQSADRGCFSFYVVSGKRDATILEYWGVEFEQNDKHYKGQFQHPKTPPEKDTYTVSTPHYDVDNNLTDVDVSTQTSFSNSDVICLSKGDKIDYYQAFKMNLLPRWDISRSKMLTLTWIPSTKGE